MRAASIPARAPAAPLRSRRLLALAGDARLVEQVRRGNEAAFEVVFERHAPAILAGAPTGAGLAEQVEERAELRHLLADVRELPDEQRAALLLTELGDLSHAEVAGVLGCEASRVKGVVFRGRW